MPLKDLQERKEYNARYHLRYYSKNRKSMLQKRADWRAKNPGYFKNRYDTVTKEKHKASVRANRYGMTVEEMEAILSATTCDACGGSFKSGIHQHIDHDHATGKIRGVLCARCNHALGFVENEQLVEQLKAYLGRTKT